MREEGGKCGEGIGEWRGKRKRDGGKKEGKERREGEEGKGGNGEVVGEEGWYKEKNGPFTCL